MAVPGNIATLALDLITNLPLFLQAVQIVAYVFFVLFFGLIASRGLRIYLGFWTGFLLRIVLGIACLVSGIALAGFIPFFNEGLLSILQLNMLAASILSAIVIAIALRMFSSRFSNAPGIQREIESLKRMLEKEGKKETGLSAFKHPVPIIGIVVIIVFLAFVLMNFRGFPDYGSDVFSAVGLSSEDLAAMEQQFREYSQTSQACRDTINLVSSLGSGLSELLNPYDNDTLKGLMEQKSGESLLQMYRADSDGKIMIIGQMNNSKYCYATEIEVCLCQ